MCSDRLENKRPALLHGGERGGTGNFLGLCRQFLCRYANVIRSFTEYTLLKRSNVKYWSSSIIHPSRSFT